jgi:hypothetical protein
MVMVIGVVVVLAGVIVGWYTVSGSGIHERPYGRDDRYQGESPLDSPWQMNEWNRGTSSSRQRRRR